ncbi:hypothetical protein [Helicobacter pylori]|uniref:hypothetical protein n=1 Tax=Helicobacter pylori TaxID=210 RepID=UPI002D1E343D|nr:hypothetical protein [Helicobacter pylori]
MGEIHRDCFFCFKRSTPIPHKAKSIKPIFFEKNHDIDNYGVAFSGIVKTQIKSSAVPHNLLECDFSADLVLTICTSQNKGYSKVFSIEAIREMEREAY